MGKQKENDSFVDLKVIGREILWIIELKGSNVKALLYSSCLVVDYNNTWIVILKPLIMFAILSKGSKWPGNSMECTL